MNRRTFFSIVTLVSIIVLSACATMAPVASNNQAASPSTFSPSNSNNPSGATTLACGAGGQSASLTPELTEGPYFKANSPERASLYEPGIAGTKLVITGYVYTPDCKPVPHALLDFWQADAKGNYDNSGYTLRGHQFSDANGRYQLTTVVPGLYPGRTEHIHVKVQAPGGKLITTQLFFPGVAQNNSDGIFNQALILSIQESNDGWQGQFNFVVPAS